MAPARIEETPNWTSLDIGIVGGGIGGLAAAIALRRAGHENTIYERTDFASEVGASVSCAANGARWLHEWDVEVQKGDPVILRSLINRDWKTGGTTKHASPTIRDCHRRCWQRHACDVIVNHKTKENDTETGQTSFENGVEAQHDVIIGADGIGSVVRNIMGVHPAKQPADSSCLHTNVTTEQAVKLGLVGYSQNSSLEYWGGHSSPNKIVLSPCNGESLLSYYCFFPRDKGKDYVNLVYQTQQMDLTGNNADLPGRHLVRRRRSCRIGDEAALGITFSQKCYPGSAQQALELYQTVRKPRATKVQAAAARAREIIHERISFSSNKDKKLYSVKDEKEKLTVEEMNAYDVYQDIEGKSGMGPDRGGLPKKFEELLVGR